MRKNKHILQKILLIEHWLFNIKIELWVALSGGELTRLYLAEVNGVSENAVIIIDEISVGLDQLNIITNFRRDKTIRV
ncbi:hypothetical protein CW304_31040 [Bacillus sp. UFRGS-B20]|nr:hypothetical protein CW304_31040 [Bacillus sp. UFRGS-B20]